MIKCAACAFENPDDGKFCVGCGQPLGRPAAEPAGPAKFCTECGAKIPADSKFCTACGKGFEAPAPGTPTGGVLADPPLLGGTTGAAFAAAYLAGLDSRLAAEAFEKIDPPAVLGLDRFLRRTKFELAQIGMVTAVCGLKVLTEPATTAYVKDFSKAVFDFALAKKGFLARNAFQQVLVYPVLVAPSAEAGVGAFLDAHWPKHWMAFEFTIVAALGSRELLMRRSTPVYQPLAHSGFKKQAERLFAI